MMIIEPLARLELIPKLRTRVVAEKSEIPGAHCATKLDDSFLHGLDESLERGVSGFAHSGAESDDAFDARCFLSWAKAEKWGANGGQRALIKGKRKRKLQSVY